MSLLEAERSRMRNFEKEEYIRRAPNKKFAAINFDRNYRDQPFIKKFGVLIDAVREDINTSRSPNHIFWYYNQNAVDNFKMLQQQKRAPPNEIALNAVNAIEEFLSGPEGQYLDSKFRGELEHLSDNIVSQQDYVINGNRLLDYNESIQMGLRSKLRRLATNLGMIYVNRKNGRPKWRVGFMTWSTPVDFIRDLLNQEKRFSGGSSNNRRRRTCRARKRNVKAMMKKTRRQ